MPPAPGFERRRRRARAARPQPDKKSRLTTACIPFSQPWRPKPQKKPVIDGPQMAHVVGPAGEEIFCDEFGRVRVQFPWDRYGKGDEYSSCWIRVAQNWAGGQYGHMAVPRIGHEVLVAFLEGDPDQPIVIGRTYHQDNLPPYPLPINKTRMTIKSKTHQGEGFNEIRFEDQTDQEEVFIHAQKDQNNVVLNNETTQVGHNRTEKVDNDELIKIGHDQRLLVENNRIEVVESDRHLHVKGERIERVDGTHHLKLGRELIIDAGQKITFKVGGSFITIDQAGVKVDGKRIDLYNGGSPSSPSAPLSITPPVFKKVDPKSTGAAVTQVSTEPSAFEETCPECAERARQQQSSGSA